MSMSMRLVESASAHRSECNCKWCRVPTCTGSLILNQQVLLFLTSGLLQRALVAVVFAVRATNLQESQGTMMIRMMMTPTQSAFLFRLVQLKF